MQPTETPDYALLASQMEALFEGVPYAVTNLSNAAALLFRTLDTINWAGFYLFRDGKLILGPFQGNPACTGIPIGRGVCGTAAETRKTQLVPDVHLFPGHIACDSASASEIVVPLIADGALLGVLDIDSPVKNRFGEEDREGLERVGGILSAMLASAI